MTPAGVRRWRLVRAGTDAVPASVRRFMRRARRRRARAAVRWVVAATVAVLVGTGAWVAYGTSTFGVREVRVVGTDVLSPLQVQEAAAVRTGTPLPRLDLEAVRARVALLAPVDSVQVRRDWPHSVVIAVVERTAVVAVPAGKRYVLVDDAGVAYQVVPERPAHLPLARLPAAPGPDDSATRAALEVLRALTPELREQLVTLVVEGPARIRLELPGGRKIIWGDATESGTKAQVATVLLARRGNIIDVSAPDVVTIR
jgi:cell division protein FtsQ